MQSRKHLRVIWGMLFLISAIAGCATPPPSTPEPRIQPSSTIPSVDESGRTTPTNEPTPIAEPQSTQTNTAMSTATIAPTPEQVSSEDEFEWTADCIITESEYTHFNDFYGLRFWWKNDADYLYFAMEGDTTGWIAVGFDPERRMEGANYLFGFHTLNQAKIWDAYGTAPTGPNHPPDEDLGGTDDILTYAGCEINGITTFEVQIPLNSGDSFDKVLEPGQTYPYIIAMGGDDSFNGYHLKYAGGQLVLDK